MRLHRFFLHEQLCGKECVLIFDADVIHQWKNVFRLQAGDKVLLLDNSGYEYLSEITLLSKEKAEVTIREARPVENALKREVWLYAALIKKDNFEWILEKGTEIGVAHFVPVVSERSEKKNLNMERAQKIVKEAAEQSGRGTLPTVSEPISLEEALAEAQVPLVAFHMEGENFSAALTGSAEETFSKSSGRPTRRGLNQTFEKVSSAGLSPVGVLIGPEGGWSDAELELFKSKNIPLYSLGKQVLRAETAAVVVSAMLLL